MWPDKDCLVKLLYQYPSDSSKRILFFSVYHRCPIFTLNGGERKPLRASSRSFWFSIRKRQTPLALLRSRLPVFSHGLLRLESPQVTRIYTNTSSKTLPSSPKSSTVERDKVTATSSPLLQEVGQCLPDRTISRTIHSSD